MATTWIRREFTAAGLTQYPTGQALRALQDRFGGSVVLCLDVSGSMYGTRLEQAVRGSERFVAEALDAHYEVGIILWHHGIVDLTDFRRGARKLERFLRRADAGGGNDIVPTLDLAEQMLDGRSGDLVVAIFGDGDLGDPHRARVRAAELQEKNIRILTCGLGDASAESLAEISTESREAPRSAATQDDLPDAIAGMASGLVRRR